MIQTFLIHCQSFMEKHSSCNQTRTTQNLLKPKSGFCGEAARKKGTNSIPAFLLSLCPPPSLPGSVTHNPLLQPQGSRWSDMLSASAKSKKKKKTCRRREKVRTSGPNDVWKRTRFWPRKKIGTANAKKKQPFKTLNKNRERPCEDRTPRTSLLKQFYVCLFVFFLKLSQIETPSCNFHSPSFFQSMKSRLLKKTNKKKLSHKKQCGLDFSSIYLSLSLSLSLCFCSTSCLLVPLSATPLPIPPPVWADI